MKKACKQCRHCKSGKCDVMNTRVDIFKNRPKCKHWETWKSYHNKQAFYADRRETRQRSTQNMLDIIESITRN